MTQAIKILTVAGIQLFSVSLIMAQQFTRINPQNAQGLGYGGNAWLDYDNDGDLDIVAFGYNVIPFTHDGIATLLYENKGGDNFESAPQEFTSELPPFVHAQMDFINTNGDDRIDMVFTGLVDGDPFQARTALIENQNGKLVDLGYLGTPYLNHDYGSLAAGDVDQNGTTDIFLSASDLAELFLSTSEGFTKSSTFSFLGFTTASAQMGDMDNDGDLDIVVCGDDGNTNYTGILLNDGTGQFTLEDYGMMGLEYSSVDLADFDNDHDLDILITGREHAIGNPTHTIIYRNDNGTFSPIELQNQTHAGSARWGDYDNDGDFDILISGQASTPEDLPLAILRNDGFEQFPEISENSFEPHARGQATWGDYDNDGDLDILVTGRKDVNSEVTLELYVLRNNHSISNQPPSAPGNFSVTPIDGRYRLTWDPSSDDLTNPNALTYNVSVKDLNTGKILLHPLSDFESGKRSVARQGNVSLNTSWELNLADGVYEIKVQAIDAGFAGSEWATQILYAGELNAPSNLTARYEDNKIKLNWTDNSNNEKNFIVERLTQQPDVYSQIAILDANVTSYEILPDEGSSQIGMTAAFVVFASSPPDNQSGLSNQATIILTGLESLSKYIRLFPNPTSDKLIFRASEEVEGELTIDISNTQGKKLFNTIRIHKNEDGVIDMSSLSTGIYLLKVSGSKLAPGIIKIIKK